MFGLPLYMPHPLSLSYPVVTRFVLHSFIGLIAVLRAPCGPNSYSLMSVPLESIVLRCVKTLNQSLNYCKSYEDKQRS